MATDGTIGGHVPTNYFTDDMGRSMENERRALLAMMAEHGTAGAAEFERARRRGMDARLESGEKAAARGAAIHAPEALQAELMGNYDRVVGGYMDDASVGSLAHTREIDRIASANKSYLEQAAASGDLMASRMEHELAKMRLAAGLGPDGAPLGAPAGGGGGGGGAARPGGGGGGASAGGGIVAGDGGFQLNTDVINPETTGNIDIPTLAAGYNQTKRALLDAHGGQMSQEELAQADADLVNDLMNQGFTPEQIAAMKEEGRRQWNSDPANVPNPGAGYTGSYGPNAYGTTSSPPPAPPASTPEPPTNWRQLLR